MENQKHIIEINGVKLEVDLRQAVRVDQMRVGTRVKVLSKEYSDYKVSHGVIIGFEPFAKLPTIIVAHAKVDYSGAKIEFLYYNSSTKDTEIVVALDDDKAALDRDSFVNHCDREIAKKQNEIKEIEDRKRYFLDKFSSYWSPVSPTV